MNAIQELEGLGYKFDLTPDGRIGYRCLTATTPKAKSLLERVQRNKEKAIEFLKTRGVVVDLKDLPEYLRSNHLRVAPAHQQRDWKTGDKYPTLVVEDIQ